MTQKILAFSVMCSTWLMFSALAFGHHGGSNYDETHTITVKGIVTEFEWTNPHALIHFEVKGENGKVENWVAQENSLNMLDRQGWNKNTLKPGDTMTIVGYRFKNGANYILGTKITANGKELTYDGK